MRNRTLCLSGGGARAALHRQRATMTESLWNNCDLNNGPWGKPTPEYIMPSPHVKGTKQQGLCILNSLNSLSLMIPCMNIPTCKWLSAWWRWWHLHIFKTNVHRHIPLRNPHVSLRRCLPLLSHCVSHKCHGVEKNEMKTQVASEGEHAIMWVQWAGVSNAETQMFFQ